MAYTTTFNETRTFGIEIEGIGLTKRQAAQVLKDAGIDATEGNPIGWNGWRVVYDGSVYNPVEAHKKFEVVSPPLAGETGLEELRTALRALREAGAEVNKSCGIHVHHDANDLDAKAIRSILWIYREFEEEIDTLLPPSRRENRNRYCRSIRPILPPHIAQDLTTHENIADHVDRYTKVNPIAYFKHGTIEFRQHSGSLDFEKISNWIRFTQAFVERSAHRSIPIKSLKRTSFAALGRRLGFKGTEDPKMKQTWEWAKDRRRHFRRREAA